MRLPEKRGIDNAVWGILSKKNLEKAELFKDALEDRDKQKVTREGRMILTLHEDVNSKNDDWVNIDMAMPDALEIGNELDRDDAKLQKIREKLREIETGLLKPLPLQSAKPIKTREQ